MRLITKIVCPLLILASSFGANADILRGITVSYTDDNADYQSSLSSIGRVELSDGFAVLVFKDRNAGKYILGNMSDAKYTAVGDSELASYSNNENKISVSADPNASSDKIRISGVTDGEIIRLFTSKGKLVYSGDDTEINLAVYPSGIYILQVGREMVKIVKS